ncbi:MAG: lipopolysaccharide biosynthesis protein [Aurantimonas endophytica]|uniref:lipopolysaccharide biosynthesis protein n=1 Tax=Aurantimonas endophytica TaxID=1522175 RepID=UPI003000FF07
MLSRKIAAGAVWLVASRLATRTLDLVAMLIVARLLLPAEFGLFALAASVLLVLNAVTDLSLSNAIIQMKDPDPAVYDAAFTLNVLRGILVAAALAAMSLPFAELYDDPRLQAILLALSAVPILKGLVSPRMAHLQRQLDFRPQFYLEAAGKVAAFLASVAVAYVTRSYWALVAGMIATPAISSIISYRLAPYRPRFGLQNWKPILGFSGWLTMSNAVNTLNWQADRLFIGGELGATTLGQYTVGSELASVPTNAPIMPIMQALYAGFAKLAHDVTRLREAYITSQCIVIALALPISVAVSVFAYPIIHLAIGPAWTPSAFVVQVLAPVLALQMLTAPAQSIAMSLGRTRSIFLRDTVSLMVRLPLIVVGMLVAGLPGVIWARVGSGLFIVILNLMLMKQLLGVSVTRQLLLPWRSFVSAIVMACVLVITGRSFGIMERVDLDRLPILVASCVFGALVYLVVHLSLWALTRPPQSAEKKLIDMATSLMRHRAVVEGQGK